MTRTLNSRVSPGRMAFGDEDSRAQIGHQAVLHASPLRASTREAHAENMNDSDPALRIVSGTVKSSRPELTDAASVGA